MRGGVLSEYPKFVLETAPTGDLINLNLVKDYLRVDRDITDQDVLIKALLSAAIGEAEAYTKRKLLSQQWSLYWDGFPPNRRLEMPISPLISLDLFEYLDITTGNWITMSASIYDLDNKTLVPAVVLNSLVPLWPLTKYLAINSVHVKITVGYSTADLVPAGITMAILRMVSTWYDNSADVVSGISVSEVPISARRLLMPYKIFTD